MLGTTRASRRGDEWHSALVIPHRKEKILDAAAGLLADNGYHSVSMAEIGERAGIVGSGIYRHFESKAAILVELFDRSSTTSWTQARSAVEGTPDLHKRSTNW